MNPEFRRNLWIELTLHRLIAMPVVLLLVFALVYVASSIDHAGNVATAAATLALGLLAVWGGHSAADAVPEEVRARTWDTQRMSAIDPWAMTWGKLFGATAFAWYGGAMALIALVAAAPFHWMHSPVKIAMLIVALSLLAQGSACLAGLTISRKGYARQGAIAGWLMVAAFFLFGPGVAVFSSIDRLPPWWGGGYELVGFALASAAAFAAWSIFGVYRAMCVELQVRTTPWAFAAFVLFLTAYLAGFGVAPLAEAASTAEVFFACGLLVSAALTYLLLFTEQTGVIVFRRVQMKLSRADFRGAAAELPCWPVGLLLAAVFGVLAVVVSAAFPGSAGEPGVMHGIAPCSLALFLLLARDAAIFLVFAFSRRPRRVEAAAFFYLILLYGVLPWLLHLAGLRRVAELVLPPVFERPGFAVAVAAVQCALAWSAVRWRWRAQQRSPANG